MEVYVKFLCPKKGANLYFAVGLSNMNRFQRKLAGMSRNKFLKNDKVSTSPEVCAWEIRSV